MDKRNDMISELELKESDYSLTQEKIPKNQLSTSKIIQGKKGNQHLTEKRVTTSTN